MLPISAACPTFTVRPNRSPSHPSFQWPVRKVTLPAALCSLAKWASPLCSQLVCLSNCSFIHYISFQMLFLCYSTLVYTDMTIQQGLGWLCNRTNVSSSALSKHENIYSICNWKQHKRSKFSILSGLWTLRNLRNKIKIDQLMSCCIAYSASSYIRKYLPTSFML